MSQVKIGIIGGSGLDNPDLLFNRTEKFVKTACGNPSDCLIEGIIENVPCVLLARHDRNHSIMPSNINYRANVLALKEAKCTHILATTACGSLQEHIRPGDIVFPDQFIDRTTKRLSTFYDGTCELFRGVCHVPMKVPFCPETRMILCEVTKELGFKHHVKGTVVTIEGPRFSSYAESSLFRQWGGDVINMTTIPEVVLAKELGLCYAAVAMATDYDCWHPQEESVSVENVLEVLKGNTRKVIEIILKAIPKIAAKDWLYHIEKHQDEATVSVMGCT